MTILDVFLGACMFLGAFIILPIAAIATLNMYSIENNY